MAMNEWPPMAICLLTATRTEYAVRTAKSIAENLKYPNLGWYLAGDGSSEEHMDEIRIALDQRGSKIFGEHSEKMGPGTSWNKANVAALEKCDLLFRLENDWELQTELDITPYVQLLLDRKDVGMIRLGGLPVELDLHSVGHSGIHYLRVEPTMPYWWSGNPSIRHRRFVDFYGPFPEGHNPGQTEVEYDAQVRSKPEGPEIWWPLSIGGYGVFAHIGQEQSY